MSRKRRKPKQVEIPVIRYKLPSWQGLPRTPEAYKQGAQAKANQAALATNPFFNFPTRQAWFAGYLEADNRRGTDAVISALVNRRKEDLAPQKS